MIVVSTCVLMATAAMGVTVPRARSCTGIVLRSAVAVSTGTGAGLRLRARRNAVGRPETADEHGDTEQGQRRPSNEPLSLKHR